VPRGLRVHRRRDLQDFCRGDCGFIDNGDLQDLCRGDCGFIDDSGLADACRRM